MRILLILPLLFTFAVLTAENYEDFPSKVQAHLDGKETKTH